jgi:S1-C subfamily serine protease
VLITIHCFYFIGDNKKKRRYIIMDDKGSDNNIEEKGQEAPEEQNEGQEFNPNVDQPFSEGVEYEYIDMESQEPEYNEPPRKNRGYLNTFFVALIAAIIGGVVVAFIIPNFYGVIHKPQQPIKIEVDEKVNIATAVAKKSMPSIVGITTRSTQELIFGFKAETEGVGTGVIVDSSGFILTNSHVVDDGNAKEVKVLLYDGETKTAKILWSDSAMDLAVIKIVASNLNVADLGNSDELKVGEAAVAIGNPLGLSFERSVTQGIISGLNRSLAISQTETIDGLIQTDASINPGNSGGPLLNAQGQVIGINTIKMQSAEGLGFAIPINSAKPIVDEIIEEGEFRKAYIGISGLNVDSVRAYDESIQPEKGVFVYKVGDNTPAEQAGIQPGDIITAVEEHATDTVSQLSKALYNYRPGDSISVKLLRKNKEMTVKVVLK